MLDIFKLIPIQFFGDGGDGGSAGGDGAVSTSGENGSTESDIPAFIPEKAKKYYRMAQEKTARQAKPVASKAVTEHEVGSDTESKETEKEKPTYKELIKSPEYAEEHKKYVENLLSERFSKNKEVEGKLKKAMEQLSVVGGKYGLDPSSENFFDDLTKAIDSDSEFFSDYALEHGIPEEEARNVAQIKAKLARYDRENAEREEKEKQNQALAQLKANAEATRAMYPNFSLETEMENPKFRQLCASLRGDTTTAYKITHYDELYNAGQREAAERAKIALSQSISSGQARPSENGLARAATAAPVTADFRGMNSKQLREYFRKMKG